MNDTPVDQPCSPVDETTIRDILKEKRVTPFFQPVVAVRSRAIIGFEAYSRVTGGESSIDPCSLFRDDLEPELMVAVDRLCREKALEQFKPIHDAYGHMLLFLNVNGAIAQYVTPEDVLVSKQLEHAGISPKNVVFECGLDTPYREALLPLSDRLAQLGVKVGFEQCSVDDAFSFAMNRIQPSFVKLGRSFFGDDERSEYASNALKALLSSAKQVGASVVGQFVESEEESIRLLLAGVDIQQGYYYTKDEDASTTDPAKMFYRKISETHEKYKVVKRKLVRRKKDRFSKTFRMVASVCSKFSNLGESQFESSCRNLVNSVEDAISVFVLNNDGLQITARAHRASASSATNSDAILGSQKGMDHSARDYVLYLDMGYDKFVTLPFVSAYTGNTACIVSKPFFNKQGMRYILCVETVYPG